MLGRERYRHRHIRFLFDARCHAACGRGAMGAVFVGRIASGRRGRAVNPKEVLAHTELLAAERTHHERGRTRETLHAARVERIRGIARLTAAITVVVALGRASGGRGRRRRADTRLRDRLEAEPGRAFDRLRIRDGQMRLPADRQITRTANRIGVDYGHVCTRGVAGGVAPAAGNVPATARGRSDLEGIVAGETEDDGKTEQGSKEALCERPLRSTSTRHERSLSPPWACQRARM